MKRICLNFAVAFLFLSCLQTNAQQMTEVNESRIAIKFLDVDFPIGKLDHQGWQQSGEVLIEKYWSGAAAPAERHAKVRLLWSDSALYVRFEANQAEPLVISDDPDRTRKTRGLWDRDVCEIFVAPDRKEPRRYFEFEIAPTGEWIDIGIYQKPDERITDWDYRSGMESTARIERGKITMAIKIPWQAFGKTPKAGDRWLGNLFRCIGSGATRGYLAWQPTRTPEPAFHVPEAFGEFEFVK